MGNDAARGTGGHEPVQGEVARAAQSSDVPGRFDDPGLPAHRHRITDIDARAAKRAEIQVTLLFLASLVGSIVFVVGYFAFPLTSGENVALQRLVTGLGLGVALFGLGAGAVHWAKKLMPDEEVVEERKPIASTRDEQLAAGEVIRQGGDAAGFPRRKLIWGSLVAALGALVLPLIVSLRDLWWRRTDERPDLFLRRTAWQEGTRLVTDPTGLPIRATDVPVGSVIHVLPEGLAGHGEALEEAAAADPEFNVLVERNKAVALVVRIEPDKLEPETQEWAFDGIVAYSQICTHVGCPIALYEHKTHHLLCPCHQSTFDLTQGARVIFGPANRPLPQLPITVDQDGYLVATGDFLAPVGPSHWEINT